MENARKALETKFRYDDSLNQKNEGKRRGECGKDTCLHANLGPRVSEMKYLEVVARSLIMYFSG